MSITTREMFVHAVGQVRNLERLGVRMLIEIADKSKGSELPRLLRDEEQARNRQDANLETCLNSLGMTPLDLPAPTVEALRERFYNFARLQPGPHVVEILAIGTALRFVYSVIVSYQELVGLADVLGERHCRQRLQDNLDQQQQYAARLERQRNEVTKRLAVETETATSK